MNWVWYDTPASVKENDLIVLLALADHADDAGRCWPGYDRIAEKSRIHVRTVPRVIERLVAAGLIEVEARPGKVNRYRLRVETCFRTPDTATGVTPGTVTGVDGGPMTQGSPASSPGSSPGSHDSIESGEAGHQESGEPSRTVNKPSGASEGAAGKPAPANARWNERMPVIVDALGEQAVRTWIDAAVPERDDGTVLTLAVPTNFFADFIGKNFCATLEEILERQIVFERRDWASRRWTKEEAKRQQKGAA